MEHDIPEKIKCPICFEIPNKEIFQCINGHTVCSDCSKKLVECPQCRVKYDTKIRNRALEDLLDMMKFDCIHKSKGCHQSFTRAELSTHLDVCSFGESGTNLCELLGYHCGYYLSTHKLQDALTHFQKYHHFIVCHDSDIDIRLEGITDFQRKTKSFWTPIIVEQGRRTGIICVIIHIYNPDDNSISPVCIQLEDGSRKQILFKLRAEFTVDSIDPTKIPDIVCSTAAINLKQVAFALQNPSIRFPLNILTTNCLKKNDSALQISCCISKSSPTTQTNHKRETIYTLNNFQSQTPPIPQSAGLNAATSLATSVERISLRPRITLPNSPVPTCPESLEHVVFNGTLCDVCRNVPINVRYKCLECLDYDLCGSCMDKGEHWNHVFAVIRSKVQEQLLRRTLITSNQWRPFFAINAPLNESPWSTFSASASCCKCRFISKYLCLQCKPVCGYCEVCFQTRGEAHPPDHFFALAGSPGKLRFVLQRLTYQPNAQGWNH